MAEALERFIRRKTDSKSSKITDILSGIKKGTEVSIADIARASKATIDQVLRIAKQTSNLEIGEEVIRKGGITKRTNPVELVRSAVPSIDRSFHHQKGHASESHTGRTIKQTSGDQ